MIALTLLVMGLHLAWGQQLGMIENFVIEDQNGDFELQEHSDKKAIVVFFTSSNCVFATRYVERMNTLHRDFKDKNILFIALNANDANLSQRDADSLMRQYTPFRFPYLKDKSQEVARQFGASLNPEAFVLVPKDGRFQVAYRGAIDDSPIKRAVSSQYVRQALKSVLKGDMPEVREVEGRGCEIRWREE